MNYKIAVVGSGISGLGAAWALAKAHNVTLFEKDSRLGGHTNTVTIDCGIDTAVDTGFIVYNEKNYPFLTSFFSHLNVKTIESNMSFAVSLDGGAFEYSSNPINLVSNWRKLNEPRFRNLVRGLIRFYGTDLDCVKGAERLTLREYLEFRRFDKQFISDHIGPMCSAIWSSDSNSIMNSPASSFVSFFSNHQLAKLSGRPRWRTVLGGSKNYVGKILSDSKNLVVKKSVAIYNIDTLGDKVAINYKNGEIEFFDKLVFATHFDDTLNLIKRPSKIEKKVLSGIKYSVNRVVLHEDIQEMPHDLKTWSSWNVIRDKSELHRGVRMSYWMNKLQRLETKRQLFVTLTPQADLKKVYYETEYTHPIFDRNANSTKTKSIEIQGKRNIWFCSACLGDGFHEDGLQAGFWVAKQIGVSLPFLNDKSFNRLPLSYQGF